MAQRRVEAAIEEAQRLTRHQVARDFRRLRSDAGMSVRGAASAAGIDATAISRFERGELMLRVDNLVALGVAIRRAAPARLSTGLWPSDP